MKEGVCNGVSTEDRDVLDDKGGGTSLVLDILDRLIT